MLDCDRFYDLLIENGVSFFTGVPDSLLKNFCACIFNRADDNKNVIAANEGNAVALAAGHHMATGDIGLVYMQNSGQGNAANPLISLADPDVYSIPLLLIIGWRGEPGVKDEPQHIKQGKITTDFLNTLGIPHTLLPTDIAEAENVLINAIDTAKKKNSPYALIVRKGSFQPCELKNPDENTYELSREDAIKSVAGNLNDNDIVVSTTGMISRELFEYREELKIGHEKDFLTVGSMGHASQIALGIALSKPHNRVYCFDGDGATIMHMGALAIIGTKKPKNFIHIVFNNGAHDSVGGQPTAGFKISISAIAKSCGYSSVFQTEQMEELKELLKKIQVDSGPSLLEIRVKKGARKDLGRPTSGPIINKENFMGFINNLK